MKILKFDICMLYTFVLYILKCKKLKITFEGDAIKVIQYNLFFKLKTGFHFLSTDVTIFGGNCHDHSSYESMIVLLDLFLISYQTF